MAESAPSLLPRVAVVLLAGGQGTRAGFDVPKQLAMLGARPVMRWSLDAFSAHPAIVGGVLVANRDVVAAEALPRHWISAEPGAERQQSVANALAALADWEDEAFILVHDAARPGVTAGVIDRLLTALGAAEAVIPTLPVPDTLVEQTADFAGEVVDRSALARVQTPQAFRLGTLRRAHAEAVEAAATDDAQLVRRLGVSVSTVPGDARLHKLTYAEDMAILAGLLGTGTMTRTAVGMGYDVHRLVADKPLWIGGIEIPYSHGLEGHSDADVGLHALTDAILGALGDGDIGDHFPPSDAQWRGAASHRFLGFAAERVTARGGRIDHVDLTIIAEAPKIGPRRAAMRARIAEILAIPLDRVSVKATTTERLGFTGRREGIAAQAVATLQLPEN